MKVTKKTVTVDGRQYTARFIDGECTSIQGSREVVCAFRRLVGTNRMYVEVVFKLNMKGRIAKKVLKALKAESTKVLTQAGTSA